MGPRSVGWFLRGLVASLVFSGWPGQSLASPVAAGEPAFIRVANGLVTVRVEEASVRDVLDEIGVQSGIKLVFHGPSTQKVSTKFRAVPLDTALQRVIGNNFLFLFSPHGQIKEVRIFSRGDSLPAPMPASPRRRALLEEFPSVDSLILQLEQGTTDERSMALAALGELARLSQPDREL